MKTVVSFGLCPFVQRSIITMNYKKEPYQVKYIDLENKPEWFLKISPLGKVPVLQVGNDVIFESAVINEYVDEISEGSLHLSDPLKKAKERAYIELAGVVTMDYFQTAIAQDSDSYLEKKAVLEKNITSLLRQYNGPFFRGEEFSLVDTSAIPALQRIALTKNLREDLDLEPSIKAKMDQWLENTLSMEAVKTSVPNGFEDDFDKYLVKRNSFIHQR